MLLAHDAGTPPVVTGGAFLSLGDRHTCEIRGGQLRCWGDGTVGQLGTGATLSTTTYPTPQPLPAITSGATALSSSIDHTCAIVGGAARCWGDNSYGELGNDSNLGSDVPVTPMGLTSGVTFLAASDSYSCGVQAGVAKCWGTNFDDQLGNGMGAGFSSNVPVDVSSLGTVMSAWAGGGHACSLLATGGVRCWGAGDSGQLGDGMSSNSNVPVVVTGFQ